ncbi:hypothetical protein WJX72_004668 [[Myrmecia] bisecta]|uniref:Enkurin domain-containing protein n=1 Tax=[Myrmecia] bisecta TaxID=41462 RepID=A0AAW1PNM6_9CHLO
MSENAEQQGLQSVHDRLGRHTAAGALLFNLYNGDRAGRNAGNLFSERNRQSFRARPARTPSAAGSGKPAPCTRATAKVSVPKFRSKGEEENKAPGLGRGRRRADVILQNTLQSEELERTRPPPPPKGPLLDDMEKERCATLMQYRGKPPELPPLDEMRSLKLKAYNSPAQSERAQLQELFESVRQEIEDRKTFLEDMRSLSKQSEYNAHAARVKPEIQERVKELERIDDLIKNC